MSAPATKPAGAPLRWVERLRPKFLAKPAPAPEADPIAEADAIAALSREVAARAKRLGRSAAFQGECVEPLRERVRALESTVAQLDDEARLLRHDRTTIDLLRLKDAASLEGLADGLGAAGPWAHRLEPIAAELRRLAAAMRAETERAP